MLGHSEGTVKYVWRLFFKEANEELLWISRGIMKVLRNWNASAWVFNVVNIIESVLLSLFFCYSSTSACRSRGVVARIYTFLCSGRRRRTRCNDDDKDSWEVGAQNRSISRRRIYQTSSYFAISHVFSRHSRSTWHIGMDAAAVQSIKQLKWYNNHFHGFHICAQVVDLVTDLAAWKL